MFGISWGGFNSIQMAMRNPPALKAFVAVMATEYLYQEDVHYMDGIMHTDSWMMSNDLYNALPGAPDFTMDHCWSTFRIARMSHGLATTRYIPISWATIMWSRASICGARAEAKAGPSPTNTRTSSWTTAKR